MLYSKLYILTGSSMTPHDISNNGTLYWCKLKPILRKVKELFKQDNIFFGTYSIHAMQGDSTQLKIGDKSYIPVIRVQQYCLPNDDNLERNITNRLTDIIGRYINNPEKIYVYIIELKNIIFSDGKMHFMVKYSEIILDV